LGFFIASPSWKTCAVWAVFVVVERLVGQKQFQRFLGAEFIVSSIAQGC